MKIEGNQQRLEARKADLSGWRIHDANLSGLWIDDANLAGANISNAKLDGMTIEGVSVTEMLACWRAGHVANPGAEAK